MKRKRFLTDCVNSTYELIHPMVDDARPITRRTFLQHVNRADLADLETRLGYVQHAKHGLTMSADWSVSYSKSVYGGQPCVFFTQSAIEYVFVGEENA